MLPGGELANLAPQLCADHLLGGLLRAGRMWWGGPARSAGLATPLPDRAGAQAGGRQQGMTEAKVIKFMTAKGSSGQRRARPGSRSPLIPGRAPRPKRYAESGTTGPPTPT